MLYCLRVLTVLSVQRGGQGSCWRPSGSRLGRQPEVASTHPGTLEHLQSGTGRSSQSVHLTSCVPKIQLVLDGERGLYRNLCACNQLPFLSGWRVHSWPGNEVGAGRACGAGDRRFGLRQEQCVQHFTHATGTVQAAPPQHRARSARPSGSRTWPGCVCSSCNSLDFRLVVASELCSLPLADIKRGAWAGTSKALRIDPRAVWWGCICGIEAGAGRVAKGGLATGAWRLRQRQCEDLHAHTACTVCHSALHARTAAYQIQHASKGEAGHHVRDRTCSGKTQDSRLCLPPVSAHACRSRSFSCRSSARDDTDMDGQMSEACRFYYFDLRS